MPYNYSICYPDKEDIEYLKTPLSAKEVLNIAKNYPWVEQLHYSDTLDQDKVCFSPSLDFECTEDGRSLGLTANFSSTKELEFSLWYKRPKQVKVLFGLLGVKEKNVVDEVWQIDFAKALKYLEYFVQKKYDKVEELYG